MSREVRLSDRVKQLSFDPSTNAFSLDSIATGFSPFRDFYEDGDVVFYAATDGTKYEVGSGEYNSNTLTRYPFRSSNISSGPYFVNDASAHGATRGKEGLFYPLYLTKSSASGIKGFAGVAEGVHEHKFSGYPGVTFYMPNTHAGHAVPAYHAGVSGENYAVSGGPVDFQGVTEVFVTYPGKTSVFTGAGVSGFSEPRKAGIAFWGNEQTLDYDSDIVWSTGTNSIGVSQPSPVYAIDVGGERHYSQVRASGFIGGGSGVYFSGGLALPQSPLKTASGGRQLEPFYRNELDNQSKTDQVFCLSGLVDQRILFKEQMKGHILAGPPSGCETVGCSPDFPEFRYLELNDIPDLSTLYVVQQNYVDYDTEIPAGAVAFTNASGKIEFDKHLQFNKSANYLGIGLGAAPSRSLDVGGDAGISGQLMVSGDAQFGGDIYAVGDLIVSGTRTYLDSTVVTVKDINLELASQSGDAINNDAAIDDAGIIVKSTNYDKKWTWRNSTDAWTTTEKIDVSGIIFDDLSTISGAYRPGSGLVLDDGIVFNVGNLFYASGTNSAGNSEHLLHQSDRLLVSGISGIQTKVIGFSGPSGLVEIDPTFLKNDIYDKIFASGNRALGLASGLAVTSGNRALGLASGLAVASGNRALGLASGLAIASGNKALELASGLANHASGHSIDVSGWTNYRIGLLGGGYNSWKVSASGDYNAVSPTHITDSISTNQSVHFMGLSGIAAEYTASDNVMRIAPSSTIFGASGYAEDLFGSLAGGYGQWRVSASGGVGYSTHIMDNISSNEAVSFMGVSGLVADYSSTTNQFLFAAPGLSGDLMTHIDNSGNLAQGFASGVAIASGNLAQSFASGVAIASGNRALGLASGLAIASGNRAFGLASGLAVASGNLAQYFASGMAIASGNSAITYASGAIVQLKSEVDAVLSPTYGSGLINQNGVVDFRHDGSGTLRHLIFDQGVRVGDGAGVGSSNINAADEKTSVMIGFESASGCHNSFDTSGVWLGFRAGALASGQQDSIYIGTRAGMQSSSFHKTNGFATPDQTENNIGIGYNALRSSLRVDNGVAIGKNAGLTMSGVYGIVSLGEGSSRYLEGAEDVVSIGTRAASDTSGIYRSVFIGRGAGSGITDFSDSIFLGYRAGALAKSDPDFAGSDIFIGENAGADSYRSPHTLFLGEQAGIRGSGVYHSTAIGRRAAWAAQDLIFVNTIGTYSSFQASGGGYNDYFGYSAGYAAKENNKVIGIGTQAGWRTFENSFSEFIGYRAGYGAIDNGQAHAIGVNAFINASGNGAAVAIGGYALSNSWDTSNVVAIGNSAGAYASGAFESIYIGQAAGSYQTAVATGPTTVATPYSWRSIAIGYFTGNHWRDRKLGSYNLIIEPYSYSDSVHQRWASDNDDYIISLGSIIHGYSTSMGPSYVSESRHLMLGKEPTNLSELQEATLQVQPQLSTDTVLKLKRDGSQAAPILESEVHFQQMSFGATGTRKQTIINRYGFLQLPIAQYATSNNIYDGNKNLIPRVDGTVVLWKKHANDVSTKPGGPHILAHIDGVWKRMTGTAQNF